MGRAAKLTIQSLKILRLFVRDPAREIAGIEVIRSSKLPSGTVYPIMARLERYGLFSSRWEMSDPETLGRPCRRYYAITARGLEMARQALRDLSVRAVQNVQNRPRRRVVPLA